MFFGKDLAKDPEFSDNDPCRDSFARLAQW